jgi:hypothetical protein
MTIYVEHQYDPREGVIRMQASGLGVQPYRVTIPCVSREAAVVALRQFVAMYRDLGCKVAA